MATIQGIRVKQFVDDVRALLRLFDSSDPYLPPPQPGQPPPPPLGAPDPGGAWPGRGHVNDAIVNVLEKELQPSYDFDQPSPTPITSGTSGVLWALLTNIKQVQYYLSEARQVALVIDYKPDPPSDGQKKKLTALNSKIDALLKDAQSLLSDGYDEVVVYKNSL